MVFFRVNGGLVAEKSTLARATVLGIVALVWNHARYWPSGCPVVPFQLSRCPVPVVPFPVARFPFPVGELQL